MDGSSKRRRVSLIIVAILLALMIINIVTLPEQRVLIAGEMRVDTLATTIQNASESEYLLPVALVSTGYGQRSMCTEEIVIRPESGTTVFVTQELSGRLSIAFDGPIHWSTLGQPATGNDVPPTFVLSPTAATCLWSEAIRLPIAGTLDVGLEVSGLQEPGTQVLALHSAKLSIFGRAIDRIFGFVPVEQIARFVPLPLAANRLYPSGTFDVPAGSRLSAGDERWWGYLDARPESERGVTLMVNTAANSVDVFVPVPSNAGETAFEPEQVSLTLAARLAGDPNIVWLFGTFTAFAFFVGLILQFVPLFLRGGTTGEHPTQPSISDATTVTHDPAARPHKPIPKRRKALLGLTVACLTALGGQIQPTRAETVYVQSGLNEGQGWVYGHLGSCWLATVKHVVQPEAGVVVSGSQDRRGAGNAIHIHADLDLAIVELVGALGGQCPASSRGDRNAAPFIQRLIQEGRTVGYERRAAGQATGLDNVPVEIIALSDAAPLFTIRTLRPQQDAVVQSDSGSPVRARGGGIGEAGLPLGLVVADTGAIETGFISVLRMDAVRAFHDQIAARSGDQLPHSKPFEIASFFGDTPNSNCSPSNLLSTGSPCGWQVRRSIGEPRAQISLNLLETREVTGIQATFAEGAEAEGVAIRTRLNERPWGAPRYCPTGGITVNCNIVGTMADEVEITFEGMTIEIGEISVY